jgi:prepilin peptidase CpaA
LTSHAAGARLLRAARENDLQTVIFFLGAAIFAFVAVSDFRTRRIPNGFIVAILLLAALRMAVAGTPTSALYTLLASAAVFAATFLLFWRGLLGGGDVKLIGATGLLIGYHDLFEFLFVMSVCGALMAVAIFAGDRLGLQLTTRPGMMPSERDHREPPDRLTVPYGIAIALAATFTLYVQSTFAG